MNLLPVVTAEEMKRLETEAIAEGMSETDFMLNAGAGVAKIVEQLAHERDKKSAIALLIGKGNNGGDAFVVGLHLLKKGFHVTAYHLYPIKEGTPLLKKMAGRFEKAEGELIHIDSPPTFTDELIVDGLVGTGFRGAASGLLLELIEEVNRSKCPVVAIDVPSGLDATSGDVETQAIHANITVFLGLPKIGYFLEEGWNHIGSLQGVDFGLPKNSIEDAHEKGYLVDEAYVASLIPKIVADRHKYSAGYVLAVAGSKGMSGAAKLSSYASLKAGAGMIRLFHPEEMESELAAAPVELIKEAWDLKDAARIFEEAKRAKALLIGPGMGREESSHAAVKDLLGKIQLPTVIDADALWFLAQDPTIKLPEYSILTPHHGEMARILDAEPTFELCHQFVKKRGVTLVLKGAPTVIFHPHSAPLIVPFGDPGMATAGSGDVLTGVIAGLLAQGLSLLKASVLGVSLHALAGEEAAWIHSSYSLVASDLIEYLGEVFNNLIDINQKN